MRPSERSLPADPLTRHEQARRDLGSTVISVAAARLLAVGFVAAIAAVPILEATGLPVLIRQAAAGVPVEGTSEIGLWRRIVATNRAVLAALTGFESALEQETRLGQRLRPPAQALLTGWLGAGNERVYPGVDGWLFYRADVEYVTGSGFLDRAVMDRRVASEPERHGGAGFSRPGIGGGLSSAPPGNLQSDPRQAIVQFSRDLGTRGIALVIVPTPLKPGVHPERLAGTIDAEDGVLHNPSYAAFVEELRREGVLVFEPSPGLAASSPDPLYLRADTHWRPEVMESVAGRLGTFIRANVQLPDVPDPGYRIERVEVANTGDTARMLDLPEDSTLFPPESVWLRRVLRADGTLWRSTRGADVLLLGDSFSNIYALESMGWGTSAGFAEQLSYTLGRPLDRIIQNDDGAFATREMLLADPGRLDGTRVVIWQFAERELSFGDWKALPMR